MMNWLAVFKLRLCSFYIMHAILSIFDSILLPFGLFLVNFYIHTIFKFLFVY